MPPERISRSEGTSLPGPRDSSPSTARTADGPSRAEVQRRVSSLYDQAETATGNYNATRAMNQGRRGRVSPAPQDASGLSASALDGVARRWFDTARARLGPSVPAALPPDRMPRPRSRPVDSPVAGAGSGSGGLPALGGGRRGADSPLLELTAGPATPVTVRQLPELTAGVPTASAVPPSGVRELPAAPTAQPSAAPGAGAETPPTPPAVETRPAEDPWPTAPQAPWSMAPQQDPWAISASQSTPAAPQTDPTLTAPDTWSDSAAPIAPDTAAPIAPATAAPIAPATGANIASNAGADMWPDSGTGPMYDSGTGPVYEPGTGPAHEPGAGSEYERKAARAVEFARAQIGRPCVWGATGPGSYDCSGLTQAAWRVAGVALPRTAQQQAASGTPVHLAELKPGDLVFFYGDAGHVGLYTGNGTMVHAPEPGASIREESIFFAGPQALHSARRPA